MHRAGKPFRRHAASFGLAAGLFVVMQHPAAHAATVEPHGAGETVTCMQVGMETRPECRKPLPPCPLQSTGAGSAGPLVMLPNGVCGMLVDGGRKEKK